jgi:hypothetical protein
MSVDEKAIDPSRFERVEPVYALGTGRIRNRVVLGRNAFIGDFVSRIWAHYGPPDSIHFEGFDYTFRDKETGLIFSAYSAGSGPAYGGNRQDAIKLEPVLAAFDRLLESTTPADCEIEYETDFGLYHSGARDGIPFDKKIKRPKSRSASRKLTSTEVDKILDELF